MANNKKYARLDDIGFVGVAKERSETEIQRDTKLMSDYISNYKSKTQNHQGAAINHPKRSHATGRFTKAHSSASKKSTSKVK